MLKNKIIVLSFLLGTLQGCATTSGNKTKNITREITKNKVIEPQETHAVAIVEVRKPSPKIIKNPVQKGEAYFQKEKAYYDVSLKGIHSGTALIEAKGMNEGTEEFSAHIKTSPFISMFFNVEHKIKSLWSQNKGSLFFSFDGIEGGTKKNRVQDVDSSHKTVEISDSKEKDGKKDSKKFKQPWLPKTQDFLSSFFFVRTIDWGNVKRKKFSILDKGKIQELEGVYKGMEKIVVNGDEYLAKIVEVQFRGNKNNLNKFWISQDNLLVKIQAQLSIGDMLFELDRYTKGNSL